MGLKDLGPHSREREKESASERPKVQRDTISPELYLRQLRDLDKINMLSLRSGQVTVAQINTWTKSM